MLLSALSTRINAYADVCQRFGFLKQMGNLSDYDIRSAAMNLTEIYSDELDICLGDEIIQFRQVVTLFEDTRKADDGSERFMYNILVERDLSSTFPNVAIMLRIYLCLIVSNCSGERSFSKLKLIKNEHRTTMGQERLNWLSLMSIESDILRQIDFTDIIDKFASLKVRKQLF